MNCRDSGRKSSSCCITSRRWFSIYCSYQFWSNGLWRFNINGNCLWRYVFEFTFLSAIIKLVFVTVISLQTSFFVHFLVLNNWRDRKRYFRQVSGSFCVYEHHKSLSLTFKIMHDPEYSIGIALSYHMFCRQYGSDGCWHSIAWTCSWCLGGSC